MRHDWAFVPALRNLHFRWQLLRTPKLSYEHRVFMSQPSEDSATELIHAAQGIYQKLWRGSFRSRGKKRSVAGDTTRLQHADGLSQTERRLLRSVGYMASQVSGTQPIRLKIGHCLFGARVCYGECLFMTISPSERHSGLVLRLSRYRRNDPIVQATEGAEEAAQGIEANDVSDDAQGAVDLAAVVGSRVSSSSGRWTPGALEMDASVPTQDLAEWF